MAKGPGLGAELIGHDAVRAVVRELGETHGKSVERRLARIALSAGLTPLASQIRKRAPKGSSLRKGIGRRNKRSRRKGIHEAKAGLNVGSRAGTARHGHLYTLGTKRRQTRAGANRGRMPADDFVSVATREAEPRVVSRMVAAIQRRLPGVVQQVARKYEGRGRLPVVTRADG